MEKGNTCNICKIRAYITCDLCETPIFFCSRGHLHSHKIKVHHNKITRNYSSSHLSRTPQKPNISQNSEENDLRKLFEHLQLLKKEADTKFSLKNYVEAILVINKCLSLSKRFYQDDHVFNIDLLFNLSECYINISNIEEAVTHLESILEITELSKQSANVAIYRYKANMLIAAASMNIGDYSRALKSYLLAEDEIKQSFHEPELNVKLASVYLNLGICYIYLNDQNIGGNFFKKGLSQTEGLLGNEVVSKLNSDLFENLGVVHEQGGKFKDALTYYKKSLKLKFNLYGETHEEVLELQYKISSVYISQKQFKEAEDVMTAMVEVVMKEKIQSAPVNEYYRYGVYLYTLGVILIKNNKVNQARIYLLKAQELWSILLPSSDPGLANLVGLIKLSEKATKGSGNSISIINKTKGKD